MSRASPSTGGQVSAPSAGPAEGMIVTMGSPRGNGLEPSGEGDYVRALERGLAVIRAFSRQHPTLSMSGVAQRAGISRAAARRLLMTLERVGYVGRADGGLFTLRPAVLALGFAYLASQGLPQLARPYMEEVANSLGCSCSLAVLDQADVVFIGRATSSRLLATTLTVGSRLPAHVTSFGRVLLSQLDGASLDRYLSSVKYRSLTKRTIVDRGALEAAIVQARHQGYATIDQELELGVRSIAVPVIGPSGVAEAALNVAVHDPTLRPADLVSKYLPALRRAARSISLASGADIESVAEEAQHLRTSR